jgi:hypothetical protein
MRTRAALSRYVFLPVSCLLTVYKRSKSISLYHPRASWLRPDVSNPTADHRLVVVSSPGQMFRIQQPITGSLLYRPQARCFESNSRLPARCCIVSSAAVASEPRSRRRPSLLPRGTCLRQTRKSEQITRHVESQSPLEKGWTNTKMQRIVAGIEWAYLGSRISEIVPRDCLGIILVARVPRQS